MLKLEDGFGNAVSGVSTHDLESENRRLRGRVAELERLATTDTLTPLFNRRYFMNELDRWCWRAQRYGGSYGLLFLDIDQLKLINDTHGHAAGDAVICGVAQAMASTTRKSDIVARQAWGQNGRDAAVACRLAGEDCRTGAEGQCIDRPLSDSKQ